MKRLCIIVLIFAMFIQSNSVMGQEAAPAAFIASPEVQADEQLEINKKALLDGPDEQLRISAAGLMLVSENPVARVVLIDTLQQTENIPARDAVCKALAQSRGRKDIPQTQTFIGPLIDILIKEEDLEKARLAAEAMLIFDYDEIEGPLEEIIADEQLPVKARLNGVSALKIQPDTRAIVRLITLLDRPEEQIVKAAGEALTSLGIPAVDKDQKTRRQIIVDIQRLGKEEFMTYWRIRQEHERQAAQLKEQLNKWKEQYMSLLEEFYSGIGSDETARYKFLANHLTSPQPEVRLWALRKVSQWWMGTEPRANLLTELGPILINLISDQEKDVRFNIAKLLSYMGELNSAEVLLKQLKNEQDDSVRLEQFAALGKACYYAFSPKSGIELRQDIKKETLDLAAEYLHQGGPAEAQKGAEVMKNLLEHDGLELSEVDEYLSAMVTRYKQTQQADTLRGELLGSMASLCAQSVYKELCISRFRLLFINALADEANPVREAAVDGLIFIDKTMALKRLRRNFINDASVKIRKRLISLAEEVGGQEDLTWLAEKMSSNSENGQAWKAMLKIFEGSGADVLSEWINILESKGISNERMIAFLGIAERRADVEDNQKLLREVYAKLAKLYKNSGEFEKAAKYLAELLKSTEQNEEKDSIRAELLSVYLRGGNIKAASFLVTNRLLEKDLDADDCFVKSIDGFAGNPQNAVQLRFVLKRFSAIETASTEPRPKWQKQLERWKELLNNTPEPNEPENLDASQPVSS